MGFEFEQACREWDRETDAEAARLVREGTPPWDAAEQARRNVRRRRLVEGMRKDEEEFRRAVFGK